MGEEPVADAMVEVQVGVHKGVYLVARELRSGQCGIERCAPRVVQLVDQRVSRADAAVDEHDAARVTQRVAEHMARLAVARVGLRQAELC